MNTHRSSSDDGTASYEFRAGTEEKATTELFVESTRTDLDAWAHHLSDENIPLAEGSDGLRIIEEFRMLSGSDRLRLPLDLTDETPLEVVLHAAGDASYSFVLEAFESFAADLDARTDIDRRLAVGGLCFVPTMVPSARINDLAQFSFLRVARAMPRLRLLEPVHTISRSMPTTEISLPTEPPMEGDARVAVFDGGVEANSAIAPWVSSREVLGIGKPVDEYLQHGMMVTSAVLFGSLDPNHTLPVPFAPVDHYRVLDENSDEDPYELYEVIRRIESVLSQIDYPFINLSIGPSLPIEDDEVHSWTAFLDEHLSDGRTLATIAIGNNGNSDRITTSPWT